MIEFVLFVLVFLAAGYPLYRKRWPEGFWPQEDDNEKLDRIRRVGRRRVLPLPFGRPRGERGERQEGGDRDRRAVR